MIDNDPRRVTFTGPDDEVIAELTVPQAEAFTVVQLALTIAEDKVARVTTLGVRLLAGDVSDAEAAEILDGLGDEFGIVEAPREPDHPDDA
jgi:hypothetical protein